MKEITLRDILAEVNKELKDNLERPIYTQQAQVNNPQIVKWMQRYDVVDVENMIEKKFMESITEFRNVTYFTSERTQIKLKNSWLSFTAKRKKTQMVGYHYNNLMVVSEVIINDEEMLDKTPQYFVDEIMKKKKEEEETKNNKYNQFLNKLSECNITPKQFYELMQEYSYLDRNVRWDFEKEQRGY